MLTARGWWLLITIGSIAFLGVVGLGWWSATIPIIGLTLLAWMAYLWIDFGSRVRAAQGSIVVKRRFVQAGREVPAVWAGLPFQVKVTITLDSPLSLPAVLATDRNSIEVLQRREPPKYLHDSVPLSAGEPIELVSTIRFQGAGSIRFEGVQLRVSDLGGLFYWRVFLREPFELHVLPPLTDDEGQRQGTKRINVLPPPGLHRLKRPGGGSELLDLRDYLPGDPPKMIAWKSSARRDRLITKEFESDVPVRCVLFLDSSNPTRLGEPGQTALAKMASIASGIAQAASATRDLVGLTVFDKSQFDSLLPARTRPHLIRMMRLLAKAAGQIPESIVNDPDQAARHALPIAKELYPDLLVKPVNSRPFGLFWVPLSDSRWLWLVLFMLVWPSLVMKREVAELVATVAKGISPSGLAWLGFLGLMFIPPAFALLFWFIYGIRGIFSPRSDNTSRRKQLAALFAFQDGSGPAGLERLLNDDGYFVKRVAQFLQRHRVILPVDMFDSNGQAIYHEPEKVEVLCRAMTLSIGRAKGNELYVILIDLLDYASEIDKLLTAIRVARARHHDVLVLVHWPDDVSLEPKPLAKRHLKRLDLGKAVRRGMAASYRAEFKRLRHQIVKAGGQALPLTAEDAVARVLDRLDRLRGAKVR